MPAKRSLLPGIILIIIGAVFLLERMNYYFFCWDTIWPIFIAVPGILMIAGSFRKGNGGSIFPGTILLLIGALFFAYNAGIFGYYNFEELWPLFMIIVGIAFIAKFLRSPGRLAGLIPGLILIVLGCIFLFNEFGYLSWYIWDEIVDFWPVILILIGFKMIAKSFFKKNRQNNDTSQKDAPE